MVPIVSLPKQLRPRELLQQNGIQALSLEESISIVLGSGVAGQSIHKLACAVASVLARPHPALSDLLAIPGIGLARASAILAAVHLSDKIKQHTQGIPMLSCPEVLYAACADILSHTQEHVVVFYLSARSTVLHREVVTVGTASASIIHPRDIFRSAIQQNASAIALAHNHPSGSLQPSHADETVTQQLVQAGKIIDITVVDHLICSPLGFTSLKMASPELFW